ncbi:MAG TPA: transglutaminase domain-containing protein [Thermomicrobiales bacterium]|jgi:hypothetical protein|nr:transglutaminase domain-containing protein [Thermomicrobiales bacterium]
MDDLARYRSHSRLSDPGNHAGWIDALPTDLATLHRAANQLVFHYFQRDQFEQYGIDDGRISEVDTRYAEDMFALLRSLDDRPLGTPRTPAQRMIGCCRDFSLLLVAMARQRRIAARSRVGSATYLMPGWAADHVVAEIYDPETGRWRLVDANLATGYIDPSDGLLIDVLDIPRDRFLVAPEAWQRCRSGAADPETFGVDPSRPEPFLRGWPYLIHNLLADLAALDRRDSVLWDTWGLGGVDAVHGPEQMDLLDALAADLADGPDGHGPDRRTVDRWVAHESLGVPAVVQSWTPARLGQPLLVSLRG